jgi:hypothetical protein
MIWVQLFTLHVYIYRRIGPEHEKKTANNTSDPSFFFTKEINSIIYQNSRSNSIFLFSKTSY